MIEGGWPWYSIPSKVKEISKAGLLTKRVRKASNREDHYFQRNIVFCSLIGNTLPIYSYGRSMRESEQSSFIDKAAPPCLYPPYIIEQYPDLLCRLVLHIQKSKVMVNCGRKGNRNCRFDGLIAYNRIERAEVKEPRQTVKREGYKLLLYQMAPCPSNSTVRTNLYKKRSGAQAVCWCC